MLDNIREALCRTYKLDLGVVDIVRGFEVVGIVRGIEVVGKVVGRGIVKGVVSNIANLVKGSMGCLSYWTYLLTHRPL